MMFNRRSKCEFMKKFGFPMCLIAMLTICIHSAAGQTNVPVAQSSTRVATNGNARASNARPNGPISHNVGRGAIGGIAPRVTSEHPTQTGAQRAVNSRSNYSAPVRSLHTSVAAINARQTAREDDVQPVAELAKNDVVQTTLLLTNTQRIPRPYDLPPTSNIPVREDITRSASAKPDVRTGEKILQPPSNELSPRQTPQSKPHNRRGNKDQPGFSDAFCRHRHEWHDRNWWKHNCTTIVFVTGGYYFLDAG
jgi:hypothetical protein